MFLAKHIIAKAVDSLLSWIGLYSSHSYGSEVTVLCSQWPCVSAFVFIPMKLYIYIFQFAKISWICSFLSYKNKMLSLKIEKLACHISGDDFFLSLGQLSTRL